MAEIIFTHPKATGPLRVGVKPNEITWSYGLNTANYPTYGGEVIQILSCYIEDMTITGNVRHYSSMEEIYRWFIDYIQLATQGKRGQGSFNKVPVTMRYPERGWTFEIIPKALPAFRYGRDVVAPEWSIQAAVVDADQNMKLAVLDAARISAIEKEGNFKLFGAVTGEIGFEADDPFRTPDVDNKKKGKRLEQGETDRNDYGALADWYNKLLPAYLENDFDDLTADYSRPAYSAGVNKGTADAKGQTDRNDS